MEKYIKANTILKFINGCLEHENKITDIEKAVLTGVKTCIERIPAADVVEVRHRHGRWHDVYLSSASSFIGTCSVCGKTNDIPPVPLAKYCPSCGAKMDGVQNE